MQEISPGDHELLDKGDVRVFRFNFDRLNLPAGVALNTHQITVNPIQQSGAGVLSFDSDAIVDNNRNVRVRLNPAAAAVGDLYQVVCTVVTNENPTQTKQRDFFIRVVD